MNSDIFRGKPKQTLSYSCCYLKTIIDHCVTFTHHVIIALYLE